MLSSFKIKKMVSALEGKLSLRFRRGKDSAYYCLGGKKVLRVRVRNGEGGDTLSIGEAKGLANSLKLDEEGVKRLYNCPMSGEEYKNIIIGILYSEKYRNTEF